jgi:hypothetical protein
MRSYKPGWDVHHIQARLALEEKNLWKKAVVGSENKDEIILITKEGTKKYLCADILRFHEIYNCGRVPVDSEGSRIVILAGYGVLIVPCAHEGKVFPKQLDVNYAVSNIVDGAAVSSPTTDGDFHLFSVDGPYPVDESEAV